MASWARVVRAATPRTPVPVWRSLATSRLHTSARCSEQEKDPQLGDYPQFPPVSQQHRRYDPRWWDKQEKRNFGETPHEEDDVLSVWAPDEHAVPPGSALRQVLVAFGLFGAFAGLVYGTLPDRPALPRTYPREGLRDELAGGPAPAEGDFDRKEEEDDDEE